MSSPSPSPSTPLILYVDDERANRIVFEQSLNTEFTIITASDGESALELVDTRDVAVVVTDMRMPGMEGDELLRLIKERQPQIIRMVMTAHQDIGPILHAINEGLVARYIVKPWDRDEMVQLLRWACEAWAFGRESAALQRRLMETERLATLGSIAGLLVHDLRQPLMSQLVNIEHLGEIAEDAPILKQAVEQASLSDEVRARLLILIADLEPTVADLKTSTLHLGEMISGLRNLGRPKGMAAGQPAPVVAVDPLPIIRHATAVCQELTIKVRSSISYEGPPVLPKVRIAHTELLQVLINVIANGAQAVAARGEANGKVLIRARMEGELLELQITDSGLGMAPEVLVRVGTPFFTTRAEGTGLGIAQCQRLIGAAGGRFRIASEQGTGTTVTLQLPVDVATR